MHSQMSEYVLLKPTPDKKRAESQLEEPMYLSSSPAKDSI